METQEKIAWRKIAEPIPFEQAQIGDVFVWTSDIKDQFTLDTRGTLYALKGDMGVIIRKNSAVVVVNFFKDAYRRSCSVNPDYIDIYKAEDYDSIYMPKYNKKGTPPKLSWRKVTEVSFEELPHIIGPNQVWKAYTPLPLQQNPYFITGPEGAFLELNKESRPGRQPFIVVNNACWSHDIEEPAWSSSGNIYKDRTPFTLIRENTVETSQKLSWQQRLDPKSIWDEQTQLSDIFWENVPNNIRFYGNGELSYDELPEHIKEGFNKAVVKCEDRWRKKKLSWKTIFGPDKDVATVMYALSGTDYPFVISVLLGLADSTERAILGALAVGGYEEASQEFDKFVEDCNSIVDGTMIYYNVNNIDTDKVKEYATTLPDFPEMEAQWNKLSQILKDLSAIVVNKKTSSVGAHVAWYFQPVPEVSPSTKAFIKKFVEKMTIEPEIALGVFTWRFNKFSLDNLKAALQNDDLIDIYNQVVWLQLKSDYMLQKAFDEMDRRATNTVTFEEVLTSDEDKTLVEEYEQKYTALYHTFQQIVGGGNA